MTISEHDAFRRQREATCARAGAAPEQQPLVFILDDDAAFREALTSLFRSVGLRVEAFESASELLQRGPCNVPSCLVLDIRLPGQSGLDLQARFAKAQIAMPIIFITGYGDVPMSVRAMKAGAFDFLTKPFREQEMLDAVSAAIELDRKRRDDEKNSSELRSRLASLTARERDILALVGGGLLNKQIASHLGLAEVTVKIHRGQLMKKVNARSSADLVRIATLLEMRRASQSEARLR
jgi:FixJ family two-component response regulator